MLISEVRSLVGAGPLPGVIRQGPLLRRAVADAWGPDDRHAVRRRSYVDGKGSGKRQGTEMLT
ncbi:hypothetical protein GCM10009783_18930 [Glycomyces lechevalierae]